MMLVTEHVEIAIAGAGLSGLGMAMALREDGHDDVVVLERADDLGGTWRDNSYPGCACDIPSVLYSFTDEQNPGWTRAFARQPEIWAYMQDLARRRELDRHFRSDHEVTAAEWDQDRQLWMIETTGGDLTAEIFISATGALADPTIPPLKGMENFRGRVFHSARWDHDHDLREVDRGSDGSVWTAGGCLSWYTDATGRNSTLWPGSVRAYQRRLRRFDPSDWTTAVRRPAPSPTGALA